MKINVLLKVSWLVISLFILFGMFLPLFTLERFYFLENQVSLVSIVIDLFKEKQLILFLAIFIFSIVIPVFKLSLIFVILFSSISSHRKAQYIKLLQILGKWSMLDVFIVAIMLVTIKFGVIANVSVHVGLYLFTCGVVGSMLLTQLLSMSQDKPNINS
ncbi:paraquat-inducible protein A [Endozoicomonas sp. SM1973]|uniref:Paraquat-inducible protein A n=1 Tax=Spartinivicinus marinus TaxID=2994442 RepID=A0A853I8G6_9GAMM|nr:paraquat-inducible protein A [Spartinivicinus marinus]MCX4027454.1 paraquat-inducible protein A [Spartinivicinus marinus]NYZ66374.1 paraquat-inducible protein A [Spartinivicinus marinus]